MKNLLIFDLDGTLLDTIKDLAISTNHALEACGHPTRPLSDYKHFVGRGINHLFGCALPPERNTPEEVARMRAAFVPYYNEHSADNTVPYPGITALLHRAKACGWKMAIASNKYQQATEELVSRLFPDVAFDAVLGQREGVPAKPDPQIVRDIVERTHATLDEVIYIGDTDIDMLTARAAGVTSVAVAWGFRTREELEACSPDHIVHAADEIFPLITAAGNPGTAPTISLRGGVACKAECRFRTPINLSIAPDEQVAIVGANGSGKTLLVNTLVGQYQLMDGASVRYGAHLSAQDVRCIAFRDSYGSADTTYYYQQRWNTTETDDLPTVAELFPQVADGRWMDELTALFGLDTMWDKKIVALSSGEMRKYQLAKALVGKPKLLFVESPFIGLDAPTRRTLTALLQRLAREWSVQTVLVVSRVEDIPDFVTHVIPVEDRVCGEKMTREAYLKRPPMPGAAPDAGELAKRMPQAKAAHHDLPEEVISCRDVNLRYGTHVILRSFSWRVRKGECWALTGPNGSGKSALLSLIYADNPQAYANPITLFGRKRGSGESIWEIKRNIGYVSPEMHRAYTRHYPAIDIVASGLHDTVGLHVKITPGEREACREWMALFGIEPLAGRDFCTLSSGEQRLALLARAFVKNPALLILDEPLHGLDNRNRRLALGIIEAYAADPEKTLIMVTHYPEELPRSVSHTLTLERHGKGGA